MKGDFSRPPRWSAGYVPDTPPVSLLAQQGQPITDWMLNMGLRLVQNELEEVVKRLTAGFDHGAITIDDKGKVKPEGVIYVAGKRVEVVEQTLTNLKTNTIHLEVILDTCDLSQIDEVPDHRLAGTAPLSLRYVSYVTTQGPPERREPCELTWAASGEGFNDVIRVEVCERTPNEQQRIRRIKWATGNAGRVYRLQTVKDSQPPKEYSIVAYGRRQTQDLVGKYGEIELRDDKQRLLPRFEGIPVRILGCEGGKLTFAPTTEKDVGELPSFALTANSTYNFWLRIWDGVDELNPLPRSADGKLTAQLVLPSPTGKTMTLTVPDPKKFSALLPGDFWLIIPRTVDQSTNAIFFYRSPVGAFELKNNGGKYSMRGPTEGRGTKAAPVVSAEEVARPLGNGTKPVGASSSTTAANAMRNPALLQRLPVRHLIGAVQSAPLRKWLSSASVAEVVNVSLNRLRENILDCGPIREHERDLFETELPRVHKAVVDLAAQLPDDDSAEWRIA